MGETITISADKTIDAYLAKPTSKPKGAIIVIHEVWGLVDHTKSVADRFAEQGFIALAPSLIDTSEFTSDELLQLQKDLFTEAKRTEVQPVMRKLTAPQQDPAFGSLTVNRLKACFNYLYDLPEAEQKVAVIGFCFGGTYSFSLAVAEPRLKIAFPFYGHSDHSAEELSQISCPIRAFYGENDERLISTLEDLKTRMKQANVDFKAKVYPDCGHAFFNDTNSITYNVTAATDAWNEVLSELTAVM